MKALHVDVQPLLTPQCVCGASAMLMMTSKDHALEQRRSNVWRCTSPPPPPKAIDPFSRIRILLLAKIAVRS